MSNVKEEQWYKDPFGWYNEHNHPELLGVQLTERVGLDFMSGLYDIYLSFKQKDYEGVIKHTEILAKLLIAGALGYGAEVIDELLVEEFDSFDIDQAFKDMTEEEANG